MCTQRSGAALFNSDIDADTDTGHHMGYHDGHSRSESKFHTSGVCTAGSLWVVSEQS